MKTTRTSTALVAAALMVCLRGASPGATITLQPDGDAGKDVSVMVTVMGDSIFGLVVNYDAGVVSGEYASPFFVASFVEFDLASVDPSATVTSATMGVYAYEAGATGNYSLHEVTDPWTEPDYDPGGDATDTWLALPATKANAENLAHLDEAGAPDWLTWDVTSLVSNWVDGSSANHGVVIAGDTGAIELWMSEHTEPALRPYLQIDYAPVPEPTTLVLLATGLLAIAGWRRRRIGKG